MQIEKINENQIEVFLNLEDLNKKGISLHSFMCNSTQNQNLFFDILQFANEKIGFCSKNYKIIIEAFLVPSKKAFILVITRVPKVVNLHISKNKYGKFKVSQCFWLQFNVLEDFCSFCDSLKNNLNIKSSLYFFNNIYFLHIKVPKIKDYFITFLLASEFSNCIYNNNFIIDENAEIIAKAYAIQTAKKYFA